MKGAETTELQQSINKLRGKMRTQRGISLLWEAYKLYPLGTKHLDRVKALMKECRVGKSKADLAQATFYRWVKPFEERAIKAGILDIDEFDTIVQIKRPKVNELVQRAQDAVEKANTFEVPLSKLVILAKNHSYKLLLAADNIVDVSSTMLLLYTGRIKDIVDKAGGADKLKMSDLALMKVYEAKIKEYMAQMQNFLQPSAIVAYLRLLNIDKLEVMPDGADFGAFTPALLLQKLEELKVSATFGNDEVADELGEKYDLAKYETINAHEVIDEENHLGGRAKVEKPKLEAIADDEWEDD